MRFYEQAIPLTLEAERRHPRQKIRKGKLDAQTGSPIYVDYHISLPPRSLREFGLWLNRYIEAMNMIRNRQVKGFEQGDSMSQVKFI